MKLHNSKIRIFVLIGLIFSFILFPGHQINCAMAPLEGFLFAVDNTYYVVRIEFVESPIVLDAQEIEQWTGLKNISYTIINPGISLEEIKNIATIALDKDVKENSKYKKELIGAKLGEPILVYNQNNKPVWWMVPVLRDGKFAASYLFDQNSGKYIGGHHDPRLTSKWFSYNDAKSALERYLTQKNIQYKSISEGIYVYYPHKGSGVRGIE